jgi:hypothetical protein
MGRSTRHPPLEPLRAALAKLSSAGIPHALGASGLCAALGLVDRVNDWDVTCDADLATLEALFADEPGESFGNSGCHADHKRNLRGGEIELIARFAFFVGDGVVHIPTRVTRHWNGVPVGSPESWAVAYALMGSLDDEAHRERRSARAELLFAWLAQHGADPVAVQALLAEPLPEWLARRLSALSKTPSA